jgi:hypothetical protein
MEEYFDSKQDRTKQYLKTHHKKHSIYIDQHETTDANDILWDQWMSDKVSIDKWTEINEKCEKENQERMITQHWHDISKKKYWEPHEWRKRKCGDYFWSRYCKFDWNEIQPYDRNAIKKEQKSVIDSVIESL